MLASLLGQRYAAVARLLESSIASDSHDVVRVRGYSQREVHHFWAEGLAISIEAGRVYLVEIFGDDHPFHRRAPHAELAPGLRFGTSSSDAQSALGAPTDAFASSGWIRYVDYPPPLDDAHCCSCLTGPGRKQRTNAVRIDELGSRHSSEECLSKKLIRVAGHEVHFYRLSEGMIVKQSTAEESATYRALLDTEIAKFTPRCYRAVDRESHVLLYIEDLTAAFACPCVMDVKMGSRTFQEKEADNPKRRLDLKEKMLKHEDGPTALTDEEREIGVTKLRYMQFREACSTSQQFGWRIEGIHLDKVEYTVAKSLKQKAELMKTLTDFVQQRSGVSRELKSEFERLRSALESSDWFMSHEVVGSSLLIIYDGQQPPLSPPVVCMIDFAHTFPVAEYGLERIKHRGPWVKGTHEEGYLDGLDSLVACFDEVAATLEAAAP